MIRFDSHKTTITLARKAVDRFAKLCMKLDIEPEDTPSEQSMIMDLQALCASYPNADLNVLLESSDFDFVHDMAGISRHMDRDDNSPTGGRLLDQFFPRFMRGIPLVALAHQRLGRGKRIDPADLTDEQLEKLKGTSEAATTEWLRRHPEAEASDGGRLG